MNASKSRRCRARIQEPGYWRDRAIEMGEMYGIWFAEFGLGGGLEKTLKCHKTMWRYKRKMLYYIRKAGAERMAASTTVEFEEGLL